MATDTMLQDQKKRTSDALDRRFAVAKAELLQEQKKSKRKIQGDNHNTGSSSIASTNQKTDAPVTPSSNTQFSKGNVTFSGYTKLQDVEENGLTYSQLSLSVHGNLLTTTVEDSSRRGLVVNKILHELFQNGDAAPKYMQGSRSMKIDNHILLDNFVQGRGSAIAAARLRALQSHSKRSKKHMSLKQHKSCGTFNLSLELHKYDIFKPMHEMWKSYMTQLLKTIGKNQLAQFLLTADLHGAIIQVVECKIASFIGVNGILIRETANAFGIITPDDKFRVVPKKVSVFVFQADCWKVTLHGDKLISRNPAS